MRELKSHGFGHFVATTRNPYIAQYVMPYQPRWSKNHGGHGGHGERHTE
jgi:hypothetical protein